MSLEEVIEQAVERGIRRALESLHPPQEEKGLLTPKEAGEIARVSPDTIRAWVHKGLLPRYGTARALRVRRADLLNMKPPSESADESPTDIAARLLGRGR